MIWNEQIQIADKIKVIMIIKRNMQKIKKGLEQKLNIISKIKNNLKIKRYDLQKSAGRNQIEFPSLDKSVPNNEKENFIDTEVKNPEVEAGSWINIKKIGTDNDQQQFLTPNLSYRKGNHSLDDKTLLTSTYTSRFASKNSLMKLVQFRTIGSDGSSKNLSAELLRKTFLEKTTRMYSPDKNKIKMMKQGSPENNMTFYGKINELNHISGTRFKTLDPRFGGLTREELKQKIKNREHIQSNYPSMTPRISQSLNMYEIQSTYNDRANQSSFSRYNFIYEQKRSEQNRKSRKKKDSRTKDRYSPWNNATQQVVWDQLPKIK